ncbi:MAG: hypothetical protein JXA19_04565 [Anaerolineales bacterium]|nr:hypothetical protein [Anaerolineales bacterium]
MKKKGQECLHRGLFLLVLGDSGHVGFCAREILSENYVSIRLLGGDLALIGWG